MSKKFLKIPQSPMHGYIFVFGPKHWAEIESEQVYGQRLSAKVRELLSLATMYLTLTLPEEVAAPPIDSKNKRTKSVLTRIEDLKDMAEALRTELFSPHYWKANYKPEYHHLLRLERQLKYELDELVEDADCGPHSKVGEFPLLRFSLNAVIESCNNVIARGREGSRFFRDGDSWATWIILLTWIMEAHEKDTRRESRRKGEAKLSSQPFLRLIRYLHGHVLGGFNSHQTDAALAKAISRARSSDKTPMAEGKELEDLIYKLLAATRTGHGKPSDLQFALQMVLNGGHSPGRHHVVSEPFFYDEDFPPPEHSSASK